MSMFKKIQSVVTWTIFTGIYYFIGYTALVQESVNAQNLLKFLIVLGFILISIVAFSKEAKKNFNNKRNETVIPYKISLMSGILCSCILAYFGWFWFAGIEFISALLYYGIKAEPKTESE